MSDSFQERFSRHFAVPLDRYEDAMLRMTLYGHARWLRLLRASDLLAADRSFIGSMGRLTRRQDVLSEVKEFRHDARNHSFWRRRVRLRVSGARVLRLLREVWPEGGAVIADGPPAVGLVRRDEAHAPS